MNHPHLTKAPVVEALVDFRVSPKPGLTVDVFAPLHDAIKDSYPGQKLMRRFESGITFKISDAGIDGAPPASSTFERSVGYRFESEDGLNIFQAQLEGFTFSRLKPYQTWESLVAEAKRMWDLYVQFAAPISISRVAVRYINRVEIPLPVADFSEYLTVAPEVPKESPQFVSEFLSRVVAHDPDSNASIILTQALEGGQEISNSLSVLLDIDVFKQDSFEVESDSYWELLNNFRALKNNAFFGSLTPKAQELFK